MDIKTHSALLVHVSSATTLDIYTHITDDMQRNAANIDRGIGKAESIEQPKQTGKQLILKQEKNRSLHRKETQARDRLYEADPRELLGGQIFSHMA